MSDWTDGLPPEAREELERMLMHFTDEALPMVEQSAIVTSIVPTPDKYDAKFMLETGAAILLDKPIVAIVLPGATIPPKLALIADRVVEVDLATEEGKIAARDAIVDAINDLARQRVLHDALDEIGRDDA